MGYTVIMVDYTNMNTDGEITEIWENDGEFTSKAFKQVIWSLFYDLTAHGSDVKRMSAYVSNLPFYKIGRDFDKCSLEVIAESKESYWIGSLDVYIYIKRSNDSVKTLYRIMNIAKF